jgi:DNA-binding transcriptional MocR family regulator
MKRDPLTQKRREFCELYVANGGNGSDAYRAIYAKSPETKPATCASGAVELLQSPHVRRHISSIRTRHRKRNNITVDRLTENLVDAFNLALDQRKPAVMAKVAMDLAKLHGLVVQKRDIAPRDLKNMTAANLTAESDLLDEKIRLAEARIATLSKQEANPRYK